MPKKRNQRNDSIQDQDLLHFIKKNEFIERYTSSEMDITSEKYLFWRDHVVPSCIPSSSELGCFVCSKKISSLPVLIRHYREQHQELIPDGIFGAKLEYVCSLCKVTFNRKEHLISHFLSDMHTRKNKENNYVMSEDILQLSSDASGAAQKRILENRNETKDISVKRPKIFHFITSSPKTKIEETRRMAQSNVETSKLSDIENLECWDSDTDLDLLTDKVLDEINQIENQQKNIKPASENDLAVNSGSESSLDSYIFFDKESCPSNGQRVYSPSSRSRDISPETLDYVTPKEIKKTKSLFFQQEENSEDRKIERTLSDYMIKNLSFD